MLFSNTRMSTHQSLTVESEGTVELTGLSAGWRVVASTGDEKYTESNFTQEGLRCIDDSEVENG